jgi:hypothetical protein
MVPVVHSSGALQLLNGTVVATRVCMNKLTLTREEVETLKRIEWSNRPIGAETPGSRDLNLPGGRMAFAGFPRRIVMRRRLVLIRRRLKLVHVLRHTGRALRNTELQLTIRRGLFTKSTSSLKTGLYELAIQLNQSQASTLQPFNPKEKDEEYQSNT